MEKLRKMMKQARRSISRRGKVADLPARAVKKGLLQKARSKLAHWSFFKKLQKIFCNFGRKNSPAKAAGPQCGPEEEQQVKQGKYRGLSGHNRSPHCTAHPPFLIPQRAAIPQWAQGMGSLRPRRCSSPWSACP